MKQVILQRAWSDERATLGMLSILGEKHNPIFTLENPLRSTDIDSRIPGGEYECGPHHSEKYPNVYEVRNVPNRTAILIHWGNFESDTTGCILVGLGSGMLEGQPAVMASKSAFKTLLDTVGDETFSLWIKERTDA